jgi:peptide/nickel transport system permease protein
MLRRFRRQRSGPIGLTIVVTVVLLALLAPLLSPRAPNDTDLLQRLQPPSRSAPFGTDELGRSVLSRVLHGARTSLLTGTLPVLAAGLIGSAIGLVAGYLRGAVDGVLMRLMDVLLAFPTLLLALAVVGTLGPGLRNAVVALALVELPIFARLGRSVTLTLRDEPYVVASRASGARTWRTLLHHVLPAALGPLLVQATLATGTTILALAGLSFLGLGVQPPTPDWGEMLARGRSYLPGSGWLLIFPGAAVALTVIGFNLLGDGLRDALDPRES